MAPHGRGPRGGRDDPGKPAGALETGPAAGQGQAHEVTQPVRPAGAFETGPAVGRSAPQEVTQPYETMHSFGMPPHEVTQPLPDIIPFGEFPYGDPRYRARRPHRLRRIIYRTTLTVATILACLAIGFGVLLLGTPSAGQATLLAARLARLHHIAYPGPPAPANFTRPLVATEDHRFYSEVGGIDPLALARTARSLATGGPDQGGATLELQLARLLWVGAAPRHSSIKAKFKEVALAVKLDARYSKSQILRLYAEVAYYGHGYYGLEQASCGYFGHPARDLTVTQGALLAGIVNAPARDDPIRHPGQARARLAHVIARMIAVGYLTPQQGRAALSAPLDLTPGHSPSC